MSKVRPKYVKMEEEEAQEIETVDGNANNANSYDLLLFVSVCDFQVYLV